MTEQNKVLVIIGNNSPVAQPENKYLVYLFEEGSPWIQAIQKVDMEAIALLAGEFNLADPRTFSKELSELYALQRAAWVESLAFPGDIVRRYDEQVTRYITFGGEPVTTGAYAGGKAVFSYDIKGMSPRKTHTVICPRYEGNGLLIRNRLVTTVLSRGRRYTITPVPPSAWPPQSQRLSQFDGPFSGWPARSATGPSAGRRAPRAQPAQPERRGATGLSAGNLAVLQQLGAIV